MRCTLVAGLLLCFVGGLKPQVHAQAPAASPPRPLSPPLLFVKIAGPAGMRVTFYRGSLEARVFEAPFTIGLRPGYCYRMALSDLPDSPRDTFFATLEVRGSLMLDGTLRHDEFPAALVFSPDDFRKAGDGIAIKKAILLERADHALPVASDKDRPIEINVPANRDLLKETNHLGQPLLLMHMGERKLEPAEMISLPGTLLLPGERALGLPPMPPIVPFGCYQTYDPVHGAMPAVEMIGLPDGGDVGLRAGLRDGKLVGVDPTDTVAAYTDSRGRKRVAVSNRLALCVPRFIVVRGETMAARHTVAAGLSGTRGVTGETIVGTRARIEAHVGSAAAEAFNSKLKASGASVEIGVAVSGELKTARSHVTTRVPAGVDAICLKAMESEPGDGVLKVIKWPDKCGALIGDIVTFFIRYQNTGGQPMTGIVIADSLHTRYEYIAGSAKTDRASTFTTRLNDAGSTLLHWDIEGELAPGEQGIVSFQVRIR